MVLHIHNRQLSSRWRGQEGPGALQVAVRANAICTLSPGQGFHLVHVRLCSTARISSASCFGRSVHLRRKSCVDWYSHA